MKPAIERTQRFRINAFYWMHLNKLRTMEFEFFLGWLVLRLRWNKSK